MNKFIYLLYLFVLFFSPLAFGTVEQWSLAIVEICSLAVAAIYYLHLTSEGKKSVHVVGIFPLSLLLLFVAFQMVPLPPALVKAIAPGNYAVYESISKVVDPGWIPLSIDPRATLHEFMRLASGIAFYCVTVQLLSHPERLKKTVRIVLMLGAAVALLAVMQRVSSPDKIFWFRNVPQNATPFGPWVNANQFAGYIELLVPLMFGLLVYSRPRIKDEASLKVKVVSFFSMPTLHLHLFYGAGTLVMILAMFVSLSRGGILSLIVAGVVFFFLYNRKFPHRGRWLLLGMFVTFLFALFWAGWDTILNEFNHSFDASGRLSDGRLTLWQDCLNIMKNFPLFGAGFGSFLALYPSFKTIEDTLIYDHAHNDYIELVTDGGLVGILLVCCFMIILLGHSWKMIRVRRDQYSILAGIGAVSGIAAIGAHSVTDFNLHNGAVFQYFFFICGVLVAAVNCRFNYFEPGTLLKCRPKRDNYIIGGTGLLLAAAVGVIQFGSFYANYLYRQVSTVYVSRHLARSHLEKMAAQMESATTFDPLEGLYSHKLGTIRWSLGDHEESLREYREAARKNPMEGVYLQQLGLLEPDPDIARQLIETGYSRAIKKSVLALNYAEWLLWKGRRGEALELFRKRMAEEYLEIPQWMVIFDGYDITREELIFVLPQSVDAYLFFGRYCEVNRSLEEASFFYWEALDYLPDSKSEIDPGWFLASMDYFRRHGKEEIGEEILRRAVDSMPEYAEFHLRLGAVYFKRGITYRAKEEFERVLILEPGNSQARSYLRKMGFADSY